MSCGWINKQTDQQRLQINLYRCNMEIKLSNNYILISSGNEVYTKAFLQL